MALELIKDPGFEFFEKLLNQSTEFLAKRCRDDKVTLHPSEELVCQRLKNGEATPEPIRLRVVKMRTK